VEIKNYQDFLNSKNRKTESCGFKPFFIASDLFDFQKELTEWAVLKGRCALFEDCGLGKTIQYLTWAENVVRKTHGKVLILTPLAVSQQVISEANKFGFRVRRTQDGVVKRGINVTNYERLKNFNPNDLAGVVCDESSIIKNMDSKTRKSLTKFMVGIAYRLLCTATPAPNDYMELGTSSEALGVMNRNEMLGMFFTNGGDTTQQWELKGHARTRFWEWMSTWAKAIRKPSDLGYEDDKFILPELKVHHHILKSQSQSNKFLPNIAVTLTEQRLEKRNTIDKRCQLAADLISNDQPCVLWCQLNAEGDTLESLIPDSVQVSGRDTDQQKERKLNGFSKGKIRVLITKPKIGGFGLNWQHCPNVVYFPTWSHESYYQAIRRCWRFGQNKPVNCHLVYTEAERNVVNGMLRKERQSQEMYDGITRAMNRTIEAKKESSNPIRLPEWL
jgi:hypothetical protein